MHTAIEPIPLIVVQGFLGRVGERLWGSFEEHLNYGTDSNPDAPSADSATAQSSSQPRSKRRRVVFANVGPISSFHDRACELFYAIKGGRVDYGAAHASAHAHGRYGRTHERGIYEEWSPTRPLHFVAHSAGGPTVMKMQHLIAEGFFGDAHHPDMVLSLNAISAPFRGTQLVYYIGELTDTAPGVRALSLGAFLGRAVHLAAYLAPLLPRTLDVHADARALSYREHSPAALARELWRSSWGAGADVLPYDVTFRAVDAREAAGEGRAHARTYYRSYVAQTDGAAQPLWRALLSVFAAPLEVSARLVERFEFSAVRPVPSFVTPKVALVHDGLEEDPTLSHVLGDEYRVNDSVVPVFSQWHPYDCTRTRCVHHPPAHISELKKSARTRSIQPGIWNVYHIDDINHFTLVSERFESQKQTEFWLEMGSYLRTLDVMYARETSTNSI
ncbi:alpha/beta-hydrolase [Gloeopeniophorella convolvens]|nr:alpha/beta-hydrolase [Gloeopeniophorella convolvens]